MSLARREVGVEGLGSQGLITRRQHPRLPIPDDHAQGSWEFITIGCTHRAPCCREGEEVISWWIGSAGGQGRNPVRRGLAVYLEDWSTPPQQDSQTE